jgi:hypothetical protein
MLVLLRPKNRLGARWFPAFLLGERLQLGEPPVVVWLYSSGPQKLQGYEPLNEEHARERACEPAGELLKFIEELVELDHADVEEPAR